MYHLNPCQSFRRSWLQRHKGNTNQFRDLAPSESSQPCPSHRQTTRYKTQTKTHPSHRSPGHIHSFPSLHSSHEHSPPPYTSPAHNHKSPATKQTNVSPTRARPTRLKSTYSSSLGARLLRLTRLAYPFTAIASTRAVVRACRLGVTRRRRFGGGGGLDGAIARLAADDLRLLVACKWVRLCGWGLCTAWADGRHLVVSCCLRWQRLGRPVGDQMAARVGERKGW